MFTIFMLLSVNWKKKKKTVKKKKKPIIFWKRLQDNKKEVILIPSAETVTAYLAICFHGVNGDMAFALSRTWK